MPRPGREDLIVNLMRRGGYESADPAADRVEETRRALLHGLADRLADRSHLYARANAACGVSAWPGMTVKADRRGAGSDATKDPNQDRDSSIVKLSFHKRAGKYDELRIERADGSSGGDPMPQAGHDPARHGPLRGRKMRAAPRLPDPGCGRRGGSVRDGFRCRGRGGRAAGRDDAGRDLVGPDPRRRTDRGLRACLRCARPCGAAGVRGDDRGDPRRDGRARRAVGGGAGQRGADAEFEHAPSEA